MMKNKSRRNFLRSASSGVAGSLLFPGFSLTNNKNTRNTILLTLSDDVNDNSEEYWEKVKSKFHFDEGLRYFNNASLGSSPIEVRSATRDFRNTLDDFPSKYMWGGWKEEKEDVRKAVAQMFSVSAEEIALIHNTTEGMNLIARSFDLMPGDEIILADHEHSSGTIPWEVWQETKGIKLVRPTLPILPEKVKDIVRVYANSITPKTKIISMCHIVNTNGMILPVREVSEMAHENGIYVAVDGAQSAGMFNINLDELACDFYAASSHKWLYSPKGVGIFYARNASQSSLKPLMVARGYKDDSIRRLENYNTRNLPEVLGLGSSIQFLNQIGLQKIHDRSYELKSYFRSKIVGNKSFKLKTPLADELSSAIQVVEVVGHNARDIKNKLYDNYKIDCRPITSFSLNGLRLSFAIYITRKDIDYLLNALNELA